MTAWLLLLQDYLAGRMDAAEFHDRFLAAWRAARDRGEPEPAPVADLFYVVEAFTPDPALRGGPYEASEEELRAAAEQAAIRLRVG